MGSLRKFRPFGDDGPVLTGQVLYFWVCAGLALIVQLLANNLLTGRWGRTINAVRQSEIASETIGVSVYRMKLKTFAFSAVLAGLAGALFAHQQGYIVSDTFTFDKSVELLVFVILGGARSLFGPLIGTTVLVILPEAAEDDRLVRHPAQVEPRAAGRARGLRRRVRAWPGARQSQAARYARRAERWASSSASSASR